MAERYKVLGAVLALREFTVADLVQFSGVKPNTVRTVLAREGSLLEELGKEPSGSKGGQFTRYRLRDEKADGLRAELQTLYQQLGTYVESRLMDGEVSADSRPLAMVAAEDALILRFPRAGDAKTKLQLIEFAQKALEEQASRLHRGTGPSENLPDKVKFHLRSLGVLIDLCSVEMVAAQEPLAVDYSVRIFPSLLISLLSQGLHLGESDHCLSLLGRFSTSYLLGQTPPLVDKEATLVSVLQADPSPMAKRLIQAIENLATSAQDLKPSVEAKSLQALPNENLTPDAEKHVAADREHELRSEARLRIESLMVEGGKPSYDVKPLMPLLRGDLLTAQQERQVIHYLPMVRHIARGIHERLPQHVPIEDLYDAGVVGLLEALGKFDPAKPERFRSYARFRVRGSILDSLRYGRVPTGLELAAQLHMEPTARPEDSGGNGLDYLPNRPQDDPFFHYMHAEMREQLNQAIGNLPERERLVMTLYYYEATTMKEISLLLGVVESRISQIHASAIMHLRAQLADVKRREDTTVKPSPPAPLSRRYRAN